MMEAEGALQRDGPWGSSVWKGRQPAGMWQRFAAGVTCVLSM